MEPVSFSIVCGLLVGEFTRLAITRKKRARKMAIKKMHRYGKTAMGEVDKASDYHLKNVDRLLDN